MSGLTLQLPGAFQRSRPVTAPRARAPLPRAFQFDRTTRLGRGTAKPVFAVVHSNGAFFPLGQRIGATHRFVALQAADRRGGGRLPPSVEAIAAGYVGQLLAEEPDGPYVLLGWCRAGAIAYEAAQQLRARGHEVVAVVMVDTWNPAFSGQLGRLRRVLAERSYSLQVILNDFVQVRRGELALRTCLRQRNAVRRLLGPMADPSAIAGSAAEAYRADKAFDQELGDQLKAACDTYRPQPLAGRVLHIRSSYEPSGFGVDRKFGWGQLIHADYVKLPGDHYTIFLEPAVHLLGQSVMDMLGLPHAPA